MINIEKELKELAQYEKTRLKYHIPFFVSKEKNIVKNQRINEYRALVILLQGNLQSVSHKPTVYLDFLKELNKLILKETASEIDSLWEDLRFSRLLTRMINLEEVVMNELLKLKATNEFKQGYNMTVNRMFSQEAQSHGDKGAPDRIAIDEIPESMRALLRSAVQHTHDPALASLEESIQANLKRNNSSRLCC